MHEIWSITYFSYFFSVNQKFSDSENCVKKFANKHYYQHFFGLIIEKEANCLLWFLDRERLNIHSNSTLDMIFRLMICKHSVCVCVCMCVNVNVVFSGRLKIWVWVRIQFIIQSNILIQCQILSYCSQYRSLTWILKKIFVPPPPILKLYNQLHIVFYI